jgi:hypothetical protein
VALVVAAVLLRKCKSKRQGKYLKKKITDSELPGVTDSSLSRNPLASRNGSIVGLFTQSKRRLLSLASIRKPSDANITPPLPADGQPCQTVESPKAAPATVDVKMQVQIPVSPELKPSSVSPHAKKLSPLGRLSVSKERRGSKDRRVTPMPTTIHVGSMDEIETDACEVGELRPNTRGRHGSVVSFADVDASSASPAPAVRKKSSPNVMNRLEQSPPRSVSPLRLETTPTDPETLPRKSSMLVRKSSKSSITPKRRLPTSALSRSISKDPSAFS